MIPSLLLLFKAERIKWRRNWAAALAFIAPISLAMFLFTFYWFLEDRADPNGPGFIAWYQVNGNGWNLFFMPITTALIAAISWDIEESAGGQKHLFTQPFSRSAHYIIKLASHLSLLIFSQLTFFILLALAGLALRRYVPTLGMGEVHLRFLFHLLGNSLLASLPLIALHTWISSRFTGLLGSLLVALAGTWTTTQLVDKMPLIQLSPWGLAAQSVTISQDGKEATGMVIGSLLCSSLLIVFGTLTFRWQKKPST